MTKLRERGGCTKRLVAFKLGMRLVSVIYKKLLQINEQK